MSIWLNKNNNSTVIIQDYLNEHRYENFFYVGNINWFSLNSIEIHLYDKVWYKYYGFKKAMYIPFKLKNNIIKLKIASLHTTNLYS